MATAAEVRSWAGQNGRQVSARGFLPRDVITDFDTAHPEDRYEAGPPRGAETNGHAPDYPDDDFEDMFPEIGAADGEVAGDTIADTGETRPRKITPRRKTGGSSWNPFGKKKTGGHNRRKPPRVSTENLLGAVWRGGAKLLTPLPPLQRTLRMQAPVAGMLLDDVVKDTFIDPVLQPLARIAAQGKQVQALVGPPFFVTAIMAHMAQRAALDPPQNPHPVFMAIATEGLRTSLMAWMDVAGPMFEIALKREQEFEEKYGQNVDAMMAFIFSEPVNPDDAEAVLAEEDAIRRAQGIL